MTIRLFEQDAVAVHHSQGRNGGDRNVVGAYVALATPREQRHVVVTGFQAAPADSFGA